MAALTSRSWTAPHGQFHDRTFSGIFSLIRPQAEHMRVDGKNRSTRAKVRPYRAALYSSMCGEGGPAGVVHRFGEPGPAETGHAQVLDVHRLVIADDRRGQLVLPVPPGVGHLGVRLRHLDDGLLAVLRCPAACGPESCCNRRSLRAARRRNFGAATFVPSDRTAKCVSPRSIPTSESTGGRVSSVVCTTNEAKYRPAASLMIVTEVGSAGSCRDQRTGTSPIFGSLSRPLSSTVNRALLGEPDRLPVVLTGPEPGRRRPCDPCACRTPR